MSVVAEVGLRLGLTVVLGSGGLNFSMGGGWLNWVGVGGVGLSLGCWVWVEWC